MSSAPGDDRGVKTLGSHWLQSILIQNFILNYTSLSNYFEYLTVNNGLLSPLHYRWKLNIC